jgi:hypothetical protein
MKNIHFENCLTEILELSKFKNLDDFNNKLSEIRNKYGIEILTSVLNRLVN